MSKKQVLALGAVIIVMAALIFLGLGRTTTKTMHQIPAGNAIPSPATTTPAPVKTTTRPSLDDFAINLPNALILVDSQGRRTGKDPTTGVDYHEIPGTSYFEEFQSGQLYFHNPAAGRYTIYVLAGRTGEYHMDSWLDDGGANHPHQVFSENIQAGMMTVYTQNYDSSNIPSSTLSFAGTASSTASITTTPAHNLPPPPVPGK